MASSSNTTSSNYYQEIPNISSFVNLPQPPPPPLPTSTSTSTSTSLFDSQLPSFLPTFRSSSIPNDPASSSQVHQPPTTLASSSSSRPSNSKKRSRASRRAPTTVLTTDTSNFRAMVQEFTGFPAPPFSSSTPYPRPRLDLTSSPFLSRPFAQKLPAATPSSLVDAIANINSSSSSNYQFVNQSSLIGGPLLAPLFGDLGSLIAASEAGQQEAAGGLPSWAADRQEFGEGSRDHQDESSIHHEKRQKNDGVVESWIHSFRLEKD